MKPLLSLTFAFSMLTAHAAAPKIHPDCLTSVFPEVCTAMVNDLLVELGYFNQVFAVTAPNQAEEAADFYHPLGTLYTTAQGKFYVGRADIQQNYFVPFLAVIRTAKVDFTPFHFSVINFDTIVAYGSLPATGVFKDGTVFTQPPLPQTLTFLRNTRYDPKRPFLIVSDHE